MSKNVLIADYDISNASALANYLNQKEVINIVALTTRGDEVLDISRRSNPDIIVINLVLNELNGLSVIKYLRTFYKGIILVYNEITKSNSVDAAIKAGADLFIIRNNLENHENLYNSIIELTDGENWNIDIDSDSVDKDIDIVVTEMLHKIQIPISIKGYRYIKSAMRLLHKDINYQDGLVKFLYADVAKEHKSTYSRVERSIRHAIEVAWRDGRDSFKDVFGFEMKSRPTNGEFLSALYDVIRLKNNVNTLSYLKIS